MAFDFFKCLLVLQGKSIFYIFFSLLFEKPKIFKEHSGPDREKKEKKNCVYISGCTITSTDFTKAT